MNFQIIRKEAGINLENGNNILQYFEVQPDDPNLSKYYCNVAYLVQEIEKEENFYVYRGGEKIEVFVNHEPNGEKFVQTKKDETSKDNLWSLPDFQHSKYDYIREATPETKEVVKEVVKYIEKPIDFKKLLPYLLSALVLGLLLPIIYCWLTGGCCTKPCPECPPVVIFNCDSCSDKPCPNYKIVVTDTVVHFKNDEVNYENLGGEDCEKTLKECFNLYKKDTTNFYLELRGYADIKGGRDYNEILASERVINVANYFLSKKINAHRITRQEEFGNSMAKKTTLPDVQARDRKVRIRIYSLEKK
jgi:outer membrane protein OmpA-like peptidoglycan-associated protein